MAKIKDITIGEGPEAAAYRLSKIDAMNASWIKTVVLNGFMKVAQQAGSGSENPDNNPDPLGFNKLSPEARGEKMVEVFWSGAAMLDEATFRSVQTHCLRSVSFHNTNGGADVYEPVLRADGRWNWAPLAEDTTAVDQLVLEALKFNLWSFFQKPLSVK